LVLDLPLLHVASQHALLIPCRPTPGPSYQNEHGKNVFPDIKYSGFHCVIGQNDEKNSGSFRRIIVYTGGKTALILYFYHMFGPEKWKSTKSLQYRRGFHFHRFDLLSVPWPGQR
jgi:hypothetical protein